MVKRKRAPKPERKNISLGSRLEFYFGLASALLSLYILGAVLFTPLDWLVGKYCTVSFSTDVNVRYFSAEKLSHTRRRHGFSKLLFIEKTADRACFADYASIKWDESTTLRKSFPEISYHRNDPLLIEREDGSFCVKQNEIQEISSGWLSWHPSFL